MFEFNVTVQYGYGKMYPVVNTGCLLLFKTDIQILAVYCYLKQIFRQLCILLYGARY